MTVGVHCRRELEREIAIMQPKIDKLDEGLKEKVGGGGARGRFLTCTPCNHRPAEELCGVPPRVHREPHVACTARRHGGNS